MPTKMPKRKGFTKAFSKTKLGYLLDKEIGKGDFLWTFDYKPKLEDNGWHPSGHCTPTLSELYHYAANREVVKEYAEGEYPENIVQRKMEPSLAKIFVVGHFWHQYLQEICLRAGLCDKDSVERRGIKSWAPETNVRQPFNFATGSADICPMDIPGHGEYLIDFKTMGSHQFRGNTPHALTMEKWECQLNVYMEFFGMDKAIILGINKDAPHDYKEFEFHRNDKLIHQIFYKWMLVSECLNEGLTPPDDEVVELSINGAMNV
jgi:hypothetical protein